MNKYFVLGTNSSISFGDHFLGLWTFFSAIKKYDIGSDNPNFILGLKNKKISFLSKWFPSIENVIFLEKDHCLINYINIHLHSKHFINQSRDCPYGYFINHNLNPNDMISPTITGNEIEEVKNAKCILFKDMGEYTGLSLDYDYVEYLKNKTGCIVNEEHLMGYDLGDVLYTIYKNDIPVIAYRNGLCDFLYFVCKNNLTIIYPHENKTTYTWLIDAKLCNHSLSLKNRINVREISEVDIKNEF